MVKQYNINELKEDTAMDHKEFEQVLFEKTKLLGVLMVNAKYSALTFYQQQKGTFLEDDEIVQVCTKVNNDIGQAIKDAAKFL
jgi:hypothetical protein